MKKGQWLKITHMEGEPQYAGKIGQVEQVDSIGQIHGSWGGCAVQPEHDTYELLTEEQAEAILAEEKRKASEYVPPFVENVRKVELPFVAMQSLSRLERLNGKQPKQVLCKVVLDLNGYREHHKEYVTKYGTNDRGGKSCIVGVPENMCGIIFGRIKQNIGMDCCPVCCVEPCDLRKNEADYLPAIDQACELAMKGA